MRIGFDAKRAFTNNTGLGNYSRILLNSMFRDFPQHGYYLYTPKLTPMYTPAEHNVHVRTPQGLDRLLSGLWRSNRVKNDLVKDGIDLYHGLSHEIPMGIQNTRIKSVVTIHDLIFERYPAQYKPADVSIYRTKFKNACKNANKVIAISLQTKQDLMDIYKVPENKIAVCYQSCDDGFMRQFSAAEKQRLAEKYKLPQQFFLYVGSVIERKNLLLICKAMKQLHHKLDMPLVVIGNGGSYMQQVKDYVQQNDLSQQVIFLSENYSVPFEDFPAIYQSALALIYPSIFEGFGIPVLEALFCRVPVITSNISCMPETGGDAAFYVDPYSVDSMADAMYKVTHETALRLSMIEKGAVHALNFTPQKAAADVMAVYNEVMK
jgi:glycosyltransferase involved in cell wall biosynthesis